MDLIFLHINLNSLKIINWNFIKRINLYMIVWDIKYMLIIM